MMNTKKNQGSGSGGGGYQNSSGPAAYSSSSNYSNAVQTAKSNSYSSNGGGGQSRPNRGGGGGGGYNGIMPQPLQQPSFFSNYGPTQAGGGYNDRGKAGGPYAAPASSSFQPPPQNAAHYHGGGGGNGHHYQTQIPTSQSFHSSNGAGGHMSAHAKYQPHQSSTSTYDMKSAAQHGHGHQPHHHHRGGGAATADRPAQVSHDNAKSLAQATTPSGGEAAQPSSRILPSPAVVNRTYSSDSSTSSSAAPAVKHLNAPAVKSPVAPEPSPVVEAPLPPPPVAVASVPVNDEEPKDAPVETPPAAPKLADLVKSRQSYEEKGEYCRDLVVAIDRLYPDVKWPLQDTWTFWFIKHDHSKEWLENVREIADASYVEDFWSVYRHMASPSKLSNSTQGDLAFFKKGITPTWEDAGNKTGGSWLHQVSIQPQQQQFNNKKYEIDDLWRESLVALIGDNFCGRDSFGLPLEESEQQTTGNDHVCDAISGVFVAQRGKQYKLTLWTKNFKDERKTRLIGRIWKQLLKLSETVTIMFEAHETKYSKTSNIKIVYKE